MPKRPMLLISTDKEDTWNVYNVMDNKFLDFQVRLPNKRFCGSSIKSVGSSISGCLPNCIYFTHDYEGVNDYQGVPHDDFGVYNLELESFLPIDATHVATLVKNTGTGRPIWVVPNFHL
ncbi:hypothetical protein M0R45_034253 [Rubus argutus]|uniref:DUF295 domain-containing protein n=1 Tax=Rubus argutus TaxID=59490 RepID=A0AAW1VV28_RUBAR